MKVRVDAADLTTSDKSDLSLDLSLLKEGLGIYAVNKQGQHAEIIFLNDSACTILGIPSDIVFPCAIDNLNLPEPEFTEFLQKLKNTALLSQECEFRQQLKGVSDKLRSRLVTLKPFNLAQQDETPGEKIYVLELSRDVSSARDALQEISEYNARLSVSLEQTAQQMWELDLTSGIFSFFDPNRGVLGSRVLSLRFPDDFMRDGWVHPDSAENFRQFARKLLGGERRGGGAFIMKAPSENGYGWYSLSFRMLYSQDHSPRKAVGVLSSLDALSAYPRFAMYGRLWRYLLSTLYCYASVNLSKGHVEQFWMAGRNLTNKSHQIDYDRFIKITSQGLFLQEDRKRLLPRYSSAHLHSLFEAGQSWLFDEFTIEERGGYLRQIASYSVLMRDEGSGELYLFTYMQYNDKTLRRDGDIRREICRIPDTGIYTESSARNLAYHYQTTGNGECAHALIRMCSAEDKEDERGYYFVASAFALFFETVAVIGQEPNNVISIFFPDCDSVLKARQLLEDAFIFVRRVLTETEYTKLRFVGVLSQGRLKPGFYDDFLKNGQNALELLKNKPTDYIEFIQPQSELENGDIGNLLYTGDMADMRYASIKDHLDKDEEQLVFKCLDAILTSGNLQNALSWILSALGHYYEADRVYVLQVLESGRSVSEISEWDANGKTSFRGLISGMSLDRLPLVKRVVTGRRPIFLNRIKRAMELSGTTSNEWSFAAYPLLSVKGGNDGFCGALIIDNPHAHGGSLALVDVLRTYLLTMLQRLIKERQEHASSQLLSTGLHDLKSYDEQVDLFNSDVYSSLGVFTVSVPQVLSLANAYGYRHVARMLDFLTELLLRSFGNSFVFRTFDSEFVILVPNTNKDIFFDRINLVQNVVQRNYPGQAFFGATWSRGAFDGESLVKEARTLMLSSQPAVGGKPVHLPQGADTDAGGTQMLKHFTVYFQPKIDMKTGSIIGAEALVRGVGADGSILPPMRFIEQMEREGTLRDLDLFVLSRVLWQQQAWQQQGLRIVPISVNFSRFTIFDASTVGAVTAILSHYHEDAVKHIEIELTETACSVEDVTLKRALAPYRSLGISLSLDDFGTGYANLSLFSKVHFDTIKIDRTLITDISVNKVSQSLLESIVRISDESKMTVIAEGVEYPEQADVLMKSGCSIAQGFLYDKALDAEKFAGKYLRAS